MVYIHMGLPWWLSWKGIRLQCRRRQSNSWVRKILGEGKGYPLQYSGLENSMDCVVHGVTKSRTRLSDFHFTYIHTHNKVLFSHRKEGNLVICDNIVGSWEHYVNWNKPERQILQGITYMWSWKEKSKTHRNREIVKWLPESGGWGK